MDLVNIGLIRVAFKALEWVRMSQACRGFPSAQSQDTSQVKPTGQDEELRMLGISTENTHSLIYTESFVILLFFVVSILVLFCTVVCLHHAKSISIFSSDGADPILLLMDRVISHVYL